MNEPNEVGAAQEIASGLNVNLTIAEQGLDEPPAQAAQRFLALVQQNIDARQVVDVQYSHSQGEGGRITFSALILTLPGPNLHWVGVDSPQPGPPAN